MQIVQYSPSYKREWDAFVSISKNATFLHYRDYMEYQKEKLFDYSLMVYSDSGRLVALFPAARVEAIVTSHSGLTFGGVLSDLQMRAPEMIQLLDELLRYCRSDDVDQIVYRAIPYIYHQVPADEDRYALFLAGSQVSRRAVLSVVDLGASIPYQERRVRSLRKASRAGLEVRRTCDFAEFWELLSDRLLATFGVRPVHTLPQIQYLHGMFPENIRLFGCYSGSELLAGVVVYVSRFVARAQYIASSDAGRRVGALDLLIDHLLRIEFRTWKWFDLGSSDEHNGKTLNVGLISQKEGFGARSVLLEHHTVNLIASRQTQPRETVGVLG